MSSSSTNHQSLIEQQLVMVRMRDEKLYDIITDNNVSNLLERWKPYLRRLKKIDRENHIPELRKQVVLQVRDFMRRMENRWTRAEFDPEIFRRLETKRYLPWLEPTSIVGAFYRHGGYGRVRSVYVPIPDYANVEADRIHGLHDNSSMPRWPKIGFSPIRVKALLRSLHRKIENNPDPRYGVVIGMLSLYMVLYFAKRVGWESEVKAYWKKVISRFEDAVFERNRNY